jgi:hypothetical protein
MGCPQVMSSGAVDLLRDTSRSNPILGQAIASYLIEPVGADPELRARVLTDQVDLIGELLNGGDQDSALAVVARLSVRESDAEGESAPWLARLVALLADYSATPGLTNSEQRHRHGRVLSSLLTHGQPFVALQALRDTEASRTCLAGDDSVAVIAAARSERFWATAFLQAHTARDGEPYLLQRVLDTAVSLAAAADFETLEQLVESRPVAPLRQLVLLLAWDRCVVDVGAAAELLRIASAGPGATDDPPNATNVFAIVQRKLEYTLSLAQFCSFHTGNSPSDYLARLTAEMVASPQVPYALRAVSTFVSLADIPDAAALGILARQPTIDGVGVVEVERDITVLRSFCAIKHVVTALKLGRDTTVASYGMPTPTPFSPEAPEATDDPEWVEAVKFSLTEAASLVQSLQPLQYRVEILECMFALLFLRAPHMPKPGAAPRSPETSAASTDDEDGDFSANGITVDAILQLLRECLAEVQDESIARTSEAMGDGVDELEARRCELTARPIPMSISRVALQARVARLEQCVTGATFPVPLHARARVCGSMWRCAPVVVVAAPPNLEGNSA